MHECTLPLIWAVETITTCHHCPPITCCRFLHLFFRRMTEGACRFTAFAAILAIAETCVAVAQLAIEVIAFLRVGTDHMQMSTSHTIATCTSCVEDTQGCITQSLCHLTKLEGRHLNVR
jgi:hypothetical protein